MIANFKNNFFIFIIILFNTPEINIDRQISLYLKKFKMNIKYMKKKYKFYTRVYIYIHCHPCG